MSFTWGSGALGYEGSQVTRSGVQGQGAAARPVAIGEPPAIILDAARVVEVEIVDLFAYGRQHVGMLHQVVEELGGAAALRADN
jgi:hypothetical protein